MSSHRNPRSFFQQVYDLVFQIPPGKVATYGQISLFLGHPQAARTVGWALHMLPQGSKVPWQRVINSSGRISIPEPEEAYEQRARLEEEGIQFDERGYIDLRRYLWDGPPRRERDQPSEIIQAGGIVFLGGDVVLRRTAKGEFVFPKGHIEEGESREEAALREVEEESGLHCRILFEAGETAYELAGDHYRVILYAMQAVKETPGWPRHQGRDAFRFTQAEAQKKISFSASRRVLKDALRRFCLLKPSPASRRRVSQRGSARRLSRR